MITSMNSAIDNEELDLFMNELEERDEMLCFLMPVAPLPTHVVAKPVPPAVSVFLSASWGCT